MNYINILETIEVPKLNLLKYQLICYSTEMFANSKLHQNSLFIVKKNNRLFISYFNFDNLLEVSTGVH